MARPKKKIDLEQMEKLAALQCTYEEISSFFGVSKSLLSKNKDYSTIIAKGREVGKISLRRKQWKLADTNASMAIFLGKNYLGQKDIQDGANGTIPEIIINVRSNTPST